MFLGSGEDAGKLLAFGASCFRTLKKYIYIYSFETGCFRVARRCRETFGIWSILLQDVKKVYIYIYTVLRLGVFRVGRRCRETFGIWSILLQDVKKVYIYTVLRLGVFRVGRRCRETFGIWSILLQDVK